MQIEPALGRRVPTRLGEVWFDDHVSEDELDRSPTISPGRIAHLDTLIDRARMPDRAGLRARYAAWRWSGDPAQMSSLFALAA